MWALVNGQWLVVTGFLVLGMAMIVLPSSANPDSFFDGQWIMAFILIALLSEALSLWVGFSAHGKVWRFRRELRRNDGDLRPITVAKYFRQHRYWRAMGLVSRVGVVLSGTLLIIADPPLLGDILFGLVLLAGTGAGLIVARRRPEPRG